MIRQSKMSETIASEAAAIIEVSWKPNPYPNVQKGLGFVVSLRNLSESPGDPTGNLEVVDGPPDGGKVPELEGVPSAFVPDYAPG
jgi:hypothetical protein